MRKQKVRTEEKLHRNGREDFNNESDVDLLIRVRPEAKLSLFDLVDMQPMLSKLVNRQLSAVFYQAPERSVLLSMLEKQKKVKNALASELESIKRHIVEKFDPDEIVLFGSLVRKVKSTRRTSANLP
ncbi:MAG: hypothetical protein AB1798_16965 [Spirochaetota bacterium]